MRTLTDIPGASRKRIWRGEPMRVNDSNELEYIYETSDGIVTEISCDYSGRRSLSLGFPESFSEVWKLTREMQLCQDGKFRTFSENDDDEPTRFHIGWAKKDSLLEEVAEANGVSRAERFWIGTDWCNYFHNGRHDEEAAARFFGEKGAYFSHEANDLLDKLGRVGRLYSLNEAKEIAVEVVSAVRRLQKGLTGGVKLRLRKANEVAPVEDLSR
jgi:hypothetical protein